MFKSQELTAHFVMRYSC